MPKEDQAGEPAPTGLPVRRAVITRLFPPWSWAIWVSALAWAVIFTAIPPAAQNFPLSDDWAFAHGAIWFANGEGIHYSRWASMPQLGQWLWSFPFLKLISLPHVALRLSSITLCILGVMAFYDLLRQFQIPAKRAAFAACVLALNPLIFISQGTYMTDVPAMAMALLSLAGFVRAMNSGSRGWLLAGTILAVLAGITRQTMLAVPLAVAIGLFAKPALRRQPVWWLALAVPLVACLATYGWFSHRTDIIAMPPVFNEDTLMVRPLIILHLCGVAVAPLVCFFPVLKDRRLFITLLVLVLAGVGMLPILASMLPSGGLFPYCAGLLGTCGASTEGGVLGHREILLGEPTRVILTLLGCLGATCLITALIRLFRTGQWPDVLVLFSTITSVLTLIVPAMEDRYYEVLFPGAIGLLASQWQDSPLRWRSGGVLVIVAGLTAVGLVHDWLSWNSVRWELGRRAMQERHLTPQEIEGGFEWDGWYATMDPAHPLPPPEISRALAQGDTLTTAFNRVYFPSVVGHYGLAFTLPEHAEVVETTHYSRWLLPGTQEFLLVKAQP